VGIRAGLDTWNKNPLLLPGIVTIPTTLPRLLKDLVRLGF